MAGELPSMERRLAAWAAGPHPALTELARSRAGAAFVDIVGCIVGGANDPAVRAVVSTVARLGRGEAVALGSSLRVAAPWAAMVGGTSAHALDFDDNFEPAFTHATAVLAPSLLALADEEGSSGSSLLEAYVVGLELQARIGRRVNPGHYSRGWHATSTLGVIGAAGACARLLGLCEDRTLAAMSIAFSMAAGSKKQFGSMMKPIHAGLAAKNAVLAARMSEAGVCGDISPIEGSWGFADLYDGAEGEIDRAEQALHGLGQRLAIEQYGLLTKRFPCCGAAHRTLDGLVALRERTRMVSADKVTRVEAVLPPFARANLRFDHPRSVMEARFSLTYCGARVLQSGQLRLEDLTPERVADAAILPLMERFVITVNESAVGPDVRAPTITRIHLQNGAVEEILVADAIGSAAHPLSAAEQQTKFIDNFSWVGRTAQVESALELCRNLQNMPHTSALTEALAEIFREQLPDREAASG